MHVHWGQKWLSIPYEGQTQVLQGLTEDAPEQILLHVDTAASSDASPADSLPLPPEIQGLLHEFEDVFKLPTALPPSRACNHEIPLIPGARPVFIRPYRYPPNTTPDSYRRNGGIFTVGATVGVLGPQQPSRPYR